MATLSPSVTISDPAVKDPKTGYGGGGAQPPAAGGGGGDRGGNGSPDYGQRLRRTRLGLLVGLVSSTMVFVSFTSVYIMRRGLPTLDDRTGGYVHDWLQVSLPTGLLLVNTLLLILSSITVELARRQITRQAALAPVQSIPGVSIGKESNFPWLGATVVLGLGFLIGTVDGLAGTRGARILSGHESKQLHGLSVDRDPRRSPGGRAAGAAVRNQPPDSCTDRWRDAASWWT